LAWDETYPGFHLYDHDICQQALAQGLANFCLDQGQDLIFHNTRGSTDVHKLASWDENVARFRRKWGLWRRRSGLRQGGQSAFQHRYLGTRAEAVEAGFGETAALRVVFDQPPTGRGKAPVRHERDAFAQRSFQRLVAAGLGDYALAVGEE